LSLHKKRVNPALSLLSKKVCLEYFSKLLILLKGDFHFMSCLDKFINIFSLAIILFQKQTTF